MVILNQILNAFIKKSSQHLFSICLILFYCFHEFWVVFSIQVLYMFCLILHLSTSFILVMINSIFPSFIEVYLTNKIVYILSIHD